MRATLLALVVLAASVATLGADAAGLKNCSPVPNAVQVQCPDVPGAGGVGITNVPGVGVFVATTPGINCGPATLPPPTGTQLVVTCTPAGLAIPCANPEAFALVDDLGFSISTTATCVGGASPSVSCTAGVFPSNVICMSPSVGVGDFPLTCRVDLVTPSGGSLASYRWVAQCAQPVG